MIESEEYLSLTTGGLPGKGGLRMRYEKPTAEIVFFDVHELFMESSSSSQCNSYDGTYCTRHAVGSGLCIYFDGTDCGTFTFTSGRICQSFRNGLCYDYDGGDGGATCSVFTCESFP